MCAVCMRMYIIMRYPVQVVCLYKLHVLLYNDTCRPGPM